MPPPGSPDVDRHGRAHRVDSHICVVHDGADASERSGVTQGNVLWKEIRPCSSEANEHASATNSSRIRLSTSAATSAGGTSRGERGRSSSFNSKDPSCVAVARIDIGFRDVAGCKLRVAIHVGQQKPPPRTREFKPPSLLISSAGTARRPRRERPYPQLPSFWEPRYSAYGWNVFSGERIPDVGIAVDLAAKYGRN